jgi:hypothetical protein
MNAAVEPSLTESLKFLNESLTVEDRGSLNQRSGPRDHELAEWRRLTDEFEGGVWRVSPALLERHD